MSLWWWQREIEGRVLRPLYIMLGKSGNSVGERNRVPLGVLSFKNALCSRLVCEQYPYVTALINIQLTTVTGSTILCIWHRSKEHLFLYALMTFWTSSANWKDLHLDFLASPFLLQPHGPPLECCSERAAAGGGNGQMLPSPSVHKNPSSTGSKPL